MTQRQIPVPETHELVDPAMAAVTAVADAARPAEAINTATWLRGFARSRTGIVASVSALGAVLLLVLLIGRGSGPVDIANDLVDGLVLRDPAAAALLADPDSLPAVARDFGVDLLPRSVTLALGERQLRELEGSTGESSQVIGSWTLTTSGPNGPLSMVEQEAMFDLFKAADGHWLVERLAVSTPVSVDLAAYFGDTGTTKAERDAALADLQAGVAWLGDTEVEATESTTDVAVDPEFTDDPDILADQETTITEAVIGKVTHWAISINGRHYTQAIEVSKARTVQERPAQIARGTLVAEAAIEDASTWARAWSVAVGAGDPGARSKVTDLAAVSGSAWERMQVQGELAFDEKASARIGSTLDPISVRYGGLELVRQRGGGWLIDPAASGLMRDWIAGSGTAIVVENHENDSGGWDWDGTTCEPDGRGATSRVTLVGVAFYAGGEFSPPLATFRFDASGDLACSGGIPIGALEVAWKGHAVAVDAPPLLVEAGTDGSPFIQTLDRWSTEGAISFVRMPLPDIQSSQAPIQIHATVDGSSRIRHDWLGSELPPVILRVAGESDFTAARP